MNPLITGEHEDKIFPVREFLHRIGKICDQEFEKLHAELVANGFPADERTKDWLFDYCFNCDPEKEQVSFEEYCDCEFMRDYRSKG